MQNSDHIHNGSLRVLMVNWIYYPEFGGGALQCRSLATALEKMDVHVSVLTRTRRKNLIGESRVDGIPVYRVGDSNGKMPCRIRAGATLASRIVKMRRCFDVVHTHGFMPEVTMMSKAMNLKVIQKVTLLGLDDGLAVRKRGCVLHKVYTSADAIVSTSRATTVAALESGVNAGKLWTIPNGVDLSRFQPVSQTRKRQLRRKLGLSAGRTVLLFIGHIQRRKGVDLLIEALHRALPAVADKPMLLLVGPSSGDGVRSDGYRAEIDKKIREKGLSEFVRIEGARDNVEDYYNAADLFVLPSRAEGQPNALLEAMACGLPSITNLLPGITDQLIADESNGFVINCERADIFARSLVRLCNEDALRKNMGAAARKSVAAKHNLYSVATAYNAMYSHLLNGS